MNTAIIITIVICITVVILATLGIVVPLIEMKKAKKHVDDFMKNFDKDFKEDW